MDTAQITVSIHTCPLMSLGQASSNRKISAVDRQDFQALATQAFDDAATLASVCQVGKSVKEIKQDMSQWWNSIGRDLVGADDQEGCSDEDRYGLVMVGQVWQLSFFNGLRWCSIRNWFHLVSLDENIQRISKIFKIIQRYSKHIATYYCSILQHILQYIAMVNPGIYDNL